MSVNSVSMPVDYTKWNGISESAKNAVSNQTYLNNNESDKFVPSTGETCTDGKDDGKIGLGSALWNTLKGVGKTAVNMVKGCFTNSEGKFSLLKTLFSAATIATCIAFPAVGLVACGIGAVSGAVQIGKGVYNAATADTDAEAKEAWQNIGGGALVTGLSVAGAKASYGAVKSTSTATNGLSSLGEDASLLAKGRALWADMKSSTANQFSTIKSAVTTKYTASKQLKAEMKELSDMQKANADALAKQAKGETLTDAEMQAISDWEHLNPNNYSETALNKMNKQNTFESLKADLKAARSAKNKSAINDAKANLQEFKESNPNILRKTFNNAKETLTEGFDKIDEVSEAFKMSKLDTASAKFLKVKSNVANLLETKGISTDKPISSIMNQLKKSDPKLFEEYGYENMLQIVQSILGNRAVNQAI